MGGLREGSVSVRGLGFSNGAGTASEAGEPVSVCRGLQEDARQLVRSQSEHRLRPGSHDGPGGGTAQRPRSVCMPVILSRPECAGGCCVLCPSLAPMLCSRTRGPGGCWAAYSPALAPRIPHPGHGQPALAPSLPSSQAWRSALPGAWEMALCRTSFCRLSLRPGHGLLAMTDLVLVTRCCPLQRGGGHLKRP